MDQLKRALKAPKDAMGALYFLPGQYLFKRLEDDNSVVTKALSSQQISLAFRDFRTDTGWLTRRILRYREEPEGNSFLAYEPAGIRRIFIETGNGEVREVKLPLPALILLGHGKEYYLWAAKEKRKITQNTFLAEAPFPNISGEFSGKVCFGRNDVPTATADTVNRVWDLIFNAPFNGDHINGKCVTAPKDVRKLLLDISFSGKKSFPASELLISRMTVGDVWDRIIGRR